MPFLELFGGVACLDFANTVDGRAMPVPEEKIRTYGDLVRWSGYAGLLDAPAVELLAATDSPAALRTALELREAIFRVFAAIGHGRPPAADDLAVVQRGYAAAMAAARLAPDIAAAPGHQAGGIPQTRTGFPLAPGAAGGGAGFGWWFGGDTPDRAWWPVAVSAVGLLTNGPLERVKVCAEDTGCAGLFLDTSKNRSRRWCSMDACGVEAKIRRQATRRRTRKES